MATPASLAAHPQCRSDHHTAAAASTLCDLTLPATVQYVRHARLPCRRVPGPPVVSFTAPPVAATASDVSSSSQDGLYPPVTRSFAEHTDPLPPSVSAASPAGASSCATAHSQAGKTETPFQVAQQFLASSGVSLRYFTNSSLYHTLRNTLDGGSMEAHDDGAAELSDAAQENLLTSPPTMAALKERFHISSSPSSAASGSIDWKKLVYVRQQCRYTGEALVTPPLSPPTDSTGNRLATNHLPHAASTSTAAAASSSAAETESSVGARLMQSLLYPFAPLASTATAAASGDHGVSTARSSTTEGGEDADLTVPHGEGVMTYVLYALPKPDYSPAPTSAMPTAHKTVERAGLQLTHIASPFLPPSLIPTEFCPALSELDDPPAVPSATALPSPTRLLLLSLVVYEGAFLHGQRHGRGRLTAFGRFVLECTWTHDVPCLSLPQHVSLSLPRPSANAPTLRRIHSHVCSPAAPDENLADAECSIQVAPPRWSLRTDQVYMGSLALTALATKRLLAKLEGVGHASSAPAVMEVHGVPYVRLALPPLPSPSSLGSGSATGSRAFSGLAWVNHVVLLPDGFGEALYRNEEGNSSRLSSIFMCPSFNHFHPPLWGPESHRVPRPLHREPQQYSPFSGSVLTSSLCTQYCGEWASGLPHGFGVELERVTDPTCAALALSSATAGAGPPLYPWRTLFLGQYVRGERQGPGTYHGPQGSEATGVVVCGTWPRTDPPSLHPAPASQSGSATVVLLPSSPSHGRGLGVSSFVTLQGARWVEDDGREPGGHGSNRGSSSGGGTFPSATLRQSPAALSGMWEPLFRAVDEVVSQASAPLLPNEPEEEDGSASASPSSSPDVMWQHARCVMDHLTQSPEFVSALLAFQACFACIYGYDTAVAAGAGSAAFTTSNEAGKQGEAPGPSSSAKDMLARLRNATAAEPAMADLPLSYPWCPMHSWCSVARLGTKGIDANGELHSSWRPATLPEVKQGCYTGCLHEPLSNGATHQQPTAARTAPTSGRVSGLSGAPCRPRRPPLSAVAAALEPHAAAHTFAHAMHSASAMVSSLRLRLLSCFAAYPDLCEIVMNHNTRDAALLTYCWDLVYHYVGPILREKAAAVAVADVRMVWDLLGLDRVPLDEEQKNDNREGAAGAATTPEVTVPPGWQPAHTESLRDYLVALRRCRALQEADFVDTSSSYFNSQDEEVAWVDKVRRCLASLEACLCTPSGIAVSMADDCSPTLQSIIGALQELHALLDGAADSRSAEEDEIREKEGEQGTFAETTVTKQPFTPSGREAFLRWLVLAASDPSSHLSSASTSPAARISKHQGHPFALLLIASFVLGGRVTPQYPVCLRLGSDQTSKGVPSDALLRLLKELGCAARQLLYTFPSIRTRTLARPLVYPLDVLFLRLEYVLSPCAMHSLLSSPPTAEAARVLPVPSLPPPHAAPGAASDIPKGVTVRVELDQLPLNVFQWCNETLTDNLTASTLQRRLQAYWSQWAAPPPSSTDKSRECRSNLPAPPSPLVRWVLGCLQSVLSAPLRQAATHQAEPSASLPPPPAPPAGESVYTWKKFISAVFLANEEEEASASAATATTTSRISTGVSPLSRRDYVYLVALAYTLRELSGIELSFAAHVVLHDDDEDEEEERDMTAAEYDEGLPGVHAKDSVHRQPSRSHLRSTESPKDRKKNIFLSSSSSSSFVNDSPTSSYRVEPREELEAEPAAEETQPSIDADDGESTRVQTPPSQADLNTPSPSALQRGSSAPVMARKASPQGGIGRVARVKRGPSVPLAESSALLFAPLGKEWTLAVRLNPDAAVRAVGSPGAASPERGFAHSLLWEVVERVGTAVELRMQERKPMAGAVGSEPHLFSIRHQ
ncbi:hypothetical protein ABL78_2080 [Leptomonas seymouri]|uniref:Uncharacterized protein n=1 Tax=Leptomonas seymouri TaxID=5684 RepID=A0A0N1I6K4_LEPSE|nr:hypothetical protein ABL78_2080 [Leptomonas seymouri]|eukprot:KPI88821.1 hypothetical protein ABL78_2080 [Leptomonas seymouri]